MKKLTVIVSGLTLLFCSSFVAGSSTAKNIVVAVAPGDDSERSLPMLIGVLSNQKWLGDQTAAKFVTAGESFRLFSNTGLSGNAKGGKPRSLGVQCEETFGVSLTPNHNSATFEIAVTSTWNPRPRAVTVLPNNSAPYLKIAKDFLETKGLKNPVVVLTSIIKTDIDNDKNPEVFMVGRHFQEISSDSAAYSHPINGKKGDYSFALMQKMINSKVQTISLGDAVILKNIAADAVPTENHLTRLYDIAGLLDLNGDGKLELVIYDAYNAGFSFEIIEWDGKKFVSKASSGCGG
jgi:hypothetical protein